MSLSSEIFGRNSFIHKLTNVMGLGVPGWLDRKFGTQPPEAQVNGIGDISRQTAKEGDPRVIVWGRVRAIGANLIHCQEPVKRWILTYAEQQGGKGGNSKKQKVYTEHTYRTYALGICEGPISGITRIWKNGALVYDARANDWGAQNNPVFMADAKIYLGGWDQMPCPDLQAIWGDVPAYRGTAYIVFINQDLTDTRGAIPQYQFEVERAEGVYLTSKPYSVESIESVSVTNPKPNRLRLRDGLINEDAGIEAVTIGQPAVSSISFRAAEFDYVSEPEDIDIGEPEVSMLSFRSGIVVHTASPEEIDIGSPEPSRLRLHEALVAYNSETQDIDIGNPTVSRLNFYVP